MIITFAIISHAKKERILKTLKSLKNQTNQNFEVVLINDKPENSIAFLDILKDLYTNFKNLKLSFNSKEQGNSNCWNAAIKASSSDYIVFVKEGDLIKKDFVAYLDNLNKTENCLIDIIEFSYNSVGLEKTISKQKYLETEKILTIQESKEVYSYIQQDIYGKIFSMKVIDENNITFRRNVRFDTLFIYMFLAHAKALYSTNKILMQHNLSILKYSIFDLINQWPHILNYYRQIGTYKDLEEQLNYAYFYQICYRFLNLVSTFNNKVLYKKSLLYSKKKIIKKIGKFHLKNSVLQDKKNPDFYERVSNFNNFLNQELKKTRVYGIFGY